MFRRHLLALALLFLLSLPSFVYSQVEDDFGVWTTFSLDTDLSKDLNVSIDQEFRLEDNATQLGRVFTDIGLDYEVENWLRFGTNYRFIMDRRGSSNIFAHRHRLSVESVLRARHQRWTVAYRARFQWEVRAHNYEQEYGFAPTYDLRNRIKLSYQYNRRFEPYTSFDIRVSIHDPDVPYLQGVDRFRVRAGTDIKLSKRQVLDLYFLYSEDVQVNFPERSFILGVAYGFGTGRARIGS